MSKALETALDRWYTSLSNQCGWGKLTSHDMKARAASDLSDADRKKFYERVGI